jgi:hypothetical protein
LLSLVGKAAGIGLAGIASLVVLLGLVLLVVGIRHPRGSDDRAIPFGWGLNILGGFVGAAFVAAGLKLLGA